MLVSFSILIGNESKTCVSKRVRLDFAPVKGMDYQDGTWKTAKAIESVTANYDPADETNWLEVALKDDDTESVEVLRETYKSNGWK